MKNNIIDTTRDTIEKVSSPSSRAGSTVERVEKMNVAGVSKSVIALQMTENSPNKKIYSETDIEAYIGLYEDAKTKVVMTAKQSRALIKDSQNKNITTPVTYLQLQQ